MQDDGMTRSEPVETPEGEDAAEEEQGAEESGEVRKYKAAEFAEAIGWEPSDLYNDLLIPVGKGEVLSLGEMKDKYDGVAKAQAEVEAARAELEKQHQQLAAYQQQIAQRFQGSTQAIDEAQGEINGLKARYQQIDWEKVEAENPGLAANEKQKFGVALAQAKAKLEQAQGEFTQQQHQAMAQQAQAEDMKLIKLVPEWQDMSKFQEELPEINEYLYSIGFTPQDLQTVMHAGARRAFREAWLWNKHQGEVSKATEKVRQAPKPVMRPGGPSRRVVGDKTRDQLMDRARATGTQQDKLAAARAIMRASFQR